MILAPCCLARVGRGTLFQCWTIEVGCQVVDGGDLLPADHLLAGGLDQLLHGADEGDVVGGLGGHGLVAARGAGRGRGSWRRARRCTSRHEPGRCRAAPMHSVLKPTFDARVEGRGHAVAVELGVRGERGVGVPGHVDLGHDGDVAFLGVGHDLRVLRLGEVAAGAAAHLRWIRRGWSAAASVDGDAPALVVGQVQVQPVHLVVDEQVDEPLDDVDAEEVPRQIQHGAPPDEAGRSRIVPGGHAPRDPAAPCFVLDGGRQELADGLQAAKDPGGPGGRQDQAASGAIRSS